ncbi:hypothetical protein QR674_01920 [Acinetobacter chinensis]|jgi:hypothetical protein|uniref:Lipoprotein n=1 Tax=Acinetobacter chinensis TaxID=2004650 RepID=A0ABU3WBH1_9GAMM|nr:hypothetical protein [Acinetobacter chinensis]MDV2467739.1 hypothetical protein [Acinetobacter chinensis]
MKSLIIICLYLFLTACSLSASKDLKHAEKLLTQFQCNNIESSDMSHTSITSYHEHLLAVTRQKVEVYVESYKKGEKLFDMPLSEIVQQQYAVYRSACQSLGGITVTADQ